MHRSHISYLVCPVDRQPLTLQDGSEFDGDFIRNGALISQSGRRYPIVDYIPRFTDDTYAANFSVQWGLYPTIQHEAHSGLTLYRRRFAEATRWEEDLSGQLVLEAGCGNGPLTPFALERGATVISFDLSAAVDHARRIIGPNIRSLFIQASLYSMPFRPGTFDKCFCFGVIQHTPDPMAGLNALVKVLKPRGLLATDCYLVPDPTAGGTHALLRAKYRFRRLRLNRLPPKLLYVAIKLYVGALWPFYLLWRDDARKSLRLRKFMFDDYRARMPGVDERLHKQSAILDIFDFLSPIYDLPQTVEGFRVFFEDAGLHNIDVHLGYNGIEGRGRKPPGSIDQINTEELAEELAQRLQRMEGNPLHDTFDRHGFHLLRKHFYLPLPDDNDKLDGFSSKMVGIDTNDTMAIDLFEHVLAPYFDEFRLRFPIGGPLSPPGFYLINGGYMAVDAHIFYGLIRHFQPRRIVEIGSGNSTMLAAAACELNREQHGHETSLTSIDPHPWDIFGKPYPGLSTLIPERVQDMPLEFFEALEENDILFIDSSHVFRMGNDVHFEYMEILPRLRSGVMVHIHDVSLPKPYPKVYHDQYLYWNEQYLLQAFLAFNSRYEVLWPGNYMETTYPERVAAAFPELQLMRQYYPFSEPTAFWMRVRALQGSGHDGRTGSVAGESRLGASIGGNAVGIAQSGDAGAFRTRTLRCLAEAVAVREAGGSDATSATDGAVIVHRRDSPQAVAAMDTANASAQEIDGAIADLALHLCDAPGDAAAAYRLASCLACRGRFDDAARIFARGIELPLPGGEWANTSIIALRPAPEPDHPLMVDLPYRRQAVLDEAGHVTMHHVELVYVIGGGSDSIKLHASELVSSIAAVADLRVGIHFHIVNPDAECFCGMAELIGSSDLPIVMSHENLTWRDADAKLLESYYQLSPFLLLSRLISLYSRPVLLLEADGASLDRPGKLVAAVAPRDAGLPVFPGNAGDFLGLFSTSPIIVLPTQEGRRFAGAVRDYLSDQLLRRRGSSPPRLAQAALAVSVLRTAELDWVALSPADLLRKSPDQGATERIREPRNCDVTCYSSSWGAPPEGHS
jgi:SAM-dependent methyltransferase